jgi:hypothetical protein
MNRNARKAKQIRTYDDFPQASISPLGIGHNKGSNTKGIGTTIGGVLSS